MANLLMPLQIERQYGASLDANYSFDTLEELKNYATTSALSYSGQILYCKENDTLYKVNKDKTDTTTLGGEKEGLFLTREEYDQLEAQGLVEMNRNYYIIGSPAPTVQQIDAIVEEKMNQALGNSGDGSNEQTEATINDWFND